MRIKNKWVTEKILKTMDNRRKSKGKNQREFDRLNKRIKQMYTKAKEKWLEKQFTAIEQDSKNCVRTRQQELC